MPQYVLAEQGEAQRWEDTALSAELAATRANGIADRYLLFTVIFASVLFFAGISGKFQRQVFDILALAFGVLALIGGVLVMFFLPIK